MAERIKIAAVGCGGMGRRHLNGMAALYASSLCNLELVAVCDTRQDNADWLADEAEQLLGARPRVYTDIARMARELSDLQAVDVTTDIVSHHTVVTACFEAGLHVLCEKPLAITLRGCKLMIDAARRSGRVLSVAENFRRDPINRLARALIDDGAIGRPRVMIQHSISGRDHILITPWRVLKHAGTTPIDSGVHAADIMRYYLGEVRSVWGESRLHEKVRRNAGSSGPGGNYARWTASFPDTVEATGDDALYAQVSFTSGAVAQWVFDSAGHGRPHRARLVYGSAGSLESPGDRNGRPLKLHLDDGTTIDDARILEHAPSYRLSSLAAELFGGDRVWTYSFEFNETDAKIIALEYHELGECIAGGQSPEVTGEEARLDLALNYAPFEAGRVGRPVTLGELIDGRADAYQREIDVKLGILAPAAV
jgi:predicted dehydrogenase